MSLLLFGWINVFPMHTFLGKKKVQKKQSVSLTVGKALVATATKRPEQWTGCNDFGGKMLILAFPLLLHSLALMSSDQTFSITVKISRFFSFSVTDNCSQIKPKKLLTMADQSILISAVLPASPMPLFITVWKNTCCQWTIWTSPSLKTEKGFQRAQCTMFIAHCTLTTPWTKVYLKSHCLWHFWPHPSSFSRKYLSL